MGDHYWTYCRHCQTDVVICGKCGNNCCNGGRGETFGQLAGVMAPCDGCDEAYIMHNSGDPATVAQEDKP